MEEQLDISDEVKLVKKGLIAADGGVCSANTYTQSFTMNTTQQRDMLLWFKKNRPALCKEIFND